MQSNKSTEQSNKINCQGTYAQNTLKQAESYIIMSAHTQLSIY